MPPSAPVDHVPQTKLDELAERYGQHNVEEVYLLWTRLVDGMGVPIVVSPSFEQLEAVLKLIFEGQP